jgi:hypothetical protein
MLCSFYSAFRDPELSRDNFIREPLRGQSGYFRFASLQSLITIKFSHSALQLELLIIAPCGFGQFDVVDACRTEVGHKQSPKRKSPSLGLEGGWGFPTSGVERNITLTLHATPISMASRIKQPFSVQHRS